MTVKKSPLCIELNQVFIYSNIWAEVFIQILKKRPLIIIKAILNPLKFKKIIDENIESDLQDIPVNPDIEKYCKDEFSKRNIYLVIDDAPNIANRICRRFGLFKGVIPSRNISQSVASEDFEYIDKNHSMTKNQVKNWTDLYKILRYQQWIKNILIFSPLILAHQLNDIEKLIATSWAFIAFSILASMTYILNDILDIESDRKHQKKKQRSFASGEVSLRDGMIIWIILASLLIIIIALTKIQSFLLLIYFVLNIFYSLLLKKFVILDVFILTSFYIIRIFYGGEIADVQLSHWFISFSGFLFLALSFIKRYEEIWHLYKNSGQTSTVGRGYRIEDLNILSMLGIACGGISALIFTLYISFSNAERNYHRPYLLWLIEILILYWFSKLWIRVNRGEVKEDPLSFAIRDKESITIFFLVALIFYLAI